MGRFRWLLRYALALLAVSVPALVILAPFRQQVGVLLFLLATAVSGWYGGRGPALLAAAVSAVLADRLLQGPIHWFLTGKVADSLGAIVFAGVVLLVGLVSAGRRRAGEAAEESNRRYRHLVDNSLGYVCAHDLDGVLLAINPAAAEALGYRPEDAVGRSLRECLAPSVRHLCDDYLQRIRQNGTDSGLMCVLSRDGVERVWTYRNLKYEEPGKAPYVVGHAVDITELRNAKEALKSSHEDLEARVAQRTADLEAANQKLRAEFAEREQAEKARRASEERYRELFENANDIFFTVDLQGNLTALNKAGEQITGYSREEALGSNISRIMSPEELDLTRRMLQRKLLNDQPTRYEVEIRAKDGRRVQLEVSTRLAREEGKPAGVHGIARDITERKRAEDAIQQAKETLQAVIQASPLAIFALDLDGTVKSWNQAAEQMFGWSESEVLGAQLPIIPAAKRQEFLERLRQASSGAPPGGVERRKVRKDGSFLDANVWHAPLRNARGAVTGVMALVADNTSHKQLEEQLRQAQKMEAIGRLAGGLAHDFNNLLTAIGGYSDLLLESVGSESHLRKDLDEIRRASERAATLIRQLLAFTRKQVLQPKVLNLNCIVTNLDQMLKRLIGEDIDLVTIPDPLVGNVRADGSQIEQVILNLAVNARDAMPNGGKLIIETANVDVGEWEAETIGLPAGIYVRLAVSDTGCGMDSETQSRVFEPFFTTKEVGKGTGLGLSTVYGIVQQSGGSISVSSEPGRGTTFSICLPRVSATADTPPAAEHLGSRSRGSGTVLLVEDSDAVRVLVRRALEHNGYRVLDARNGGEALLISERHTGALHLLVTDVVMPGMNGGELAERVSVRHPETRVLFMSGYPDGVKLQTDRRHPEMAFLQKPFKVVDLIHAVQDLATVPRSRQAVSA